jgi:CheY-like chemotaxis protein
MARFLVVDDDHRTVSGLTRLLNDDGHDVAPFTAGADAVEALSTAPFDAVLTDLEMPHVDGHEVVRVARERNPEACIVVVSASGHKESDLVEAGACFVADKPLDYDGVTGAITECRARGQHVRCHLRSRAGGEHPGKLRRK